MKSVKWLLLAGIILLAAAAPYRLYLEFHRLLFVRETRGAIDLIKRSVEVDKWFSGEPVYTAHRAAYPPASFVLLWPFVGWPPVEATRWIWGVFSVVALIALGALSIRIGNADNRLQSTFLFLLPFAMNATGVAIGNGQLIVVLLPLLLGAFWLLQKKDNQPVVYIPATLMMVFAMAQPTIAMPFLWLLVLIPRFRPVALPVAIFYLGLTVFAIQFQPENIFALVKLWNLGTMSDPETIPAGYGNLQTWLFSFGWNSWSGAATIAAFLGLGAWLYAHRNADVWMLTGVVAVFARLWAYHRMYDDLLVLPAVLAIFREVKKADQRDEMRITGAIILAAAVVLSLARLSNVSELRYQVLTTANVIVWLAIMSWLVVCTAGVSAIRTDESSAVPNRSI